jgi:hypothetical protein
MELIHSSINDPCILGNLKPGDQQSLGLVRAFNCLNLRHCPGHLPTAFDPGLTHEDEIPDVGEPETSVPGCCRNHRSSITPAAHGVDRHRNLRLSGTVSRGFSI